MKTLGLGHIIPLQHPLPSCDGVYHLSMSTLKTSRGTFLSAHCLPDVYMLCHRSTLYLLVAMIVYMT
jgi:hypothetical protein